MTFSSAHAHALLYASFGLDAWWPLLYLEGDGWARTRPDRTGGRRRRPPAGMAGCSA